MSSDIRSILERLAAVEGKLTPVGVKHGLNTQQKGVPQLPALFKPKSASPALRAKKDPAHPMDGYMVGDSVEPRKSALEEAMQEVEEDMLSKVKKDLTQYLDQLEKKVKIDRELKDKAKDAVEKHTAEEEIEENDYELTDPSTVHGIEDKIDTQLGNPQQPIKVMELDDGAIFEIHGDEGNGYEIRHRGRSLPSRFRTSDEAGIAVDLFRAHKQRNRPEQNLNQDYIEER
jgi:hypothetical protein